MKNLKFTQIALPEAVNRKLKILAITSNLTLPGLLCKGFDRTRCGQVGG